MNVVSAAQRARDHTSVVRPKHLLSIRKTGTKHWPQTLFQDLGGVDSLQLYHSTGRFTARIRPARLLTKSYEARPITTTEERNDNAKDDLFGRNGCDCRCGGGLRLVAFDADPIAAARDGSRGG